MELQWVPQLFWDLRFQGDYLVKISYLDGSVCKAGTIYIARRGNE